MRDRYEILNKTRVARGLSSQHTRQWAASTIAPPTASTAQMWHVCIVKHVAKLDDHMIYCDTHVLTM